MYEPKILARNLLGSSLSRSASIFTCVSKSRTLDRPRTWIGYYISYLVSKIAPELQTGSLSSAGVGDVLLTESWKLTTG